MAAGRRAAKPQRWRLRGEAQADLREGASGGSRLKPEQYAGEGPRSLRTFSPPRVPSASISSCPAKAGLQKGRILVTQAGELWMAVPQSHGQDKSQTGSPW